MAFDLNTIITQQVAYFPYFTAISGPLTDIQEGDEIDTRGGGKVEVPLCGTNGKDIVLNPIGMSHMPVREQNFMMCQLTLAVARRQHLLRMGRDPKVWNRACAEVRLNEINEWMESCEESGDKIRITKPESVEFNPAFRGMDESQVYDILKQEDDGGEGDSNGAGTVCDSPGFGDNAAENKAHAEQASSEVMESLRMAEARAAQAGKGSGFWADLADKLDNVGPDPEALLAEFVDNSMVTGRSWSRPDPRYWAMGQYYPGEVKDNIGEMVVALDCSGSMGRDEIAEMLSWVKGAAERCRPKKIHVIYFTGAVERHDEFAYNEEFQVPEQIPSGGTCFASVRKYIDEQGIDPKAELWMTDGYDQFPQEPEYPVLWMMTTDVLVPYGRRVQFHLKGAQACW